MKTIILCFVLFAVVMAKPRWVDYDIEETTMNDGYEVPRALPVYGGCKLDDKICKKKTVEDCDKYPVVKRQCPRLCGECALFESKCPKEYEHGCCWNGEPATSNDKKNCPACVNTGGRTCLNPVYIKECNNEKSSPLVRKLCPLVCGACTDYGNLCKDAEPSRCFGLDYDDCEDEEIQNVCQKSCGLCRDFTQDQ